MKRLLTCLMIFHVFCISLISGPLAYPASAVGGVDNNPEAVRKVIKRISSDRRFQYPDEVKKMPVIGQDEPNNGCMQVFRPTEGGFGFGDVTFDLAILTYILYGIAVVVLTFFIYRLVLHLHPALRAGSGEGSNQTGDIFEDLNASSQLALAEELFRKGLWAEALSALRMSLLLTLDSRNLIRYHRSRTNREYLRRLQQHPILFTVAREFIHNFEEMKFGRREPDSDGVTYMLDLYRQAETALPPVASETASPMG